MNDPPNPVSRVLTGAKSSRTRSDLELINYMQI